MIGGQDITIAVPAGAVALDLAVRVIKRHWPQAVFVADESPRIVTRYDHLEFHDNSEIVAYKDLAACMAWRQLGYDESLRGTMIYLLSDPADLTLVVEQVPSRAIQILLAAIQDGLRSTARYFTTVAA